MSRLNKLVLDLLGSVEALEKQLESKVDRATYDNDINEIKQRLAHLNGLIQGQQVNVNIEAEKVEALNASSNTENMKRIKVKKAENINASNSTFAKNADLNGGGIEKLSPGVDIEADEVDHLDASTTNTFTNLKTRGNLFYILLAVAGICASIGGEYLYTIWTTPPPAEIIKQDINKETKDTLCEPKKLMD